MVRRLLSSKMSVIQMRMYESMMPGSRIQDKTRNSQRGFIQKEGIKSKKAGFTFLDEVIGCPGKIEKMKMWS